MEHFLYLDIETIPSTDPDYAKRVRDTITPPKNFKNPESIEKWMAENADAAVEEKIAKTSFDGGRGHVCCIGWAWDDEPVLTAVLESGTFYEPDVLGDFFRDIPASHRVTIVGHNVADFDIKFLTHRAIVLGVLLPPANVWPRDVKPWDGKVFDTMTKWAGARDRISLDELCDILGIPGKDGFDGSMVAEAWANGEYEKIARYCADDVERVRKIHKRFMEVGY